VHAAVERAAMVVVRARNMVRSRFIGFSLNKMFVAREGTTSMAFREAGCDGKLADGCVALRA
jgi:hypothetical protein